MTVFIIQVRFHGRIAWLKTMLKRKGESLVIQTYHCKDWKSDERSRLSLEQKSVLKIRKGKTNWRDIMHKETWIQNRDKGVQNSSLLPGIYTALQQWPENHCTPVQQDRKHPRVLKLGSYDPGSGNHNYYGDPVN